MISLPKSTCGIWLALGSVAAAQCPPRWHASGLTSAGADGMVLASVVWDLDGPGPLPSVLVAAGDFRVVNDVRARGIATWDGAIWRALPDPGFTITSLAAAPAQLIAGGWNTGGPIVGRFDGSAWTILGSGPDPSRPVMAVALYAGDVYAAGNFSSLGGAGGKLVRFSGGSWSVVPGAFTQPNRYPRALSVWNGRLAAIGTSEFDLWDGQSIATNTSLSLLPNCLWVHNGDLYVGTHTFLVYALVLRWNGGGWDVVGSNIGPSFQQASVMSLCSFDGELYAGGDFTTFGTVPGRGLARWRDPQWESVAGAGYGFPLTTYAGRLIALNFGYGSGSPVTSRIAAWDGAAWAGIQSLPAISGSFNALARIGPDLWAGGDGLLSDSQGNQSAAVARVHDGVWTAEPGLPLNFGVGSIVEFQGAVYASGGTSSRGPAVYRRDPTAWTDTGLVGVGVRIPRIVNWNASLVATGFFQRPDSTWFSAASWNGASWTELPDPPGSPGSPYGCAVIDGHLYAFGYSGSSGYVARFENGQWATLGGSFNGAVTSLVSFSGSLIAGGTFESPGLHVARWSGQAWGPFGPGVPAFINALASQADRLIAGGSIYGSDDPPLGLYAWDGATWTNLVSPDDRGGVAALLPETDGSLWVGGSFSHIGELVSPSLVGVALTCYANCDCSTTPPVLNVLDFSCFLSNFSAGAPSANCDGSTTPPILNVLDFNCFLNRFTAGCP
jgi:hypothetical protein